ncbi:hypothetical protein TanjilG_19846 [Lupinus angustifolius]|uniref:Protein kinase domain-containing protein n=1 Tax=Lupinus angustifolius TaxID=3871 RepID=A0A1J7HEW5_LUPAN|nr:PREDICTED: probable serine/threonine-protein kinase PBL11 [Lupinus angustifolius]OIW00905.1 hypothetical protein TanjilG_19846 [Lupinus angustifolius]
MGCFILKSKKKRSDQVMQTNRVIGNNHVPAVLPEPQTHTQAQSASASFRTKFETFASIKQVTENRTHVLSAPSALDPAEHNASVLVEHLEQEESKHHVGPMKEQRSSTPRGVISLASIEHKEREESRHLAGLTKEQSSPTPQPLPLPLPPWSSCALKGTSRINSGTLSGPQYASGFLPLPPTGLLRNFLYAEIAAACDNFSSDRCMMKCLSSVVYRASFHDDASSLKKFGATVNLLHTSTKGLKEFINEVNTLASLQHPYICKLLGFHARVGSEPRMLVFEKLCHGSLDHLLFGKFDGPPLDWNTRIKIAICAAQGLTFLHEEGPFQAMYNDFSTANIQIDKDFSAKLSGYGCVGHVCEEEISNYSSAVGCLPVETLQRGILTPKSNVWSFGIILLELLTGRKNLDSYYPKEERDLVKWSSPFLVDGYKLLTIMDPKLKGRFPCKAARALAEITQRCLKKEPSERPNMRTVVNHLEIVLDLRYSRWLEPEALISGEHMLRSLSPNCIISTSIEPKLNFSPPNLPISTPPLSPPSWTGVPLHPSQACSSTLVEELNKLENG